MKQDLLLLVGRLLVASFFVLEAVDKVRRFDEWTAFVAEAGMPLPAAEMVLVVVLLLVGSACLVTGWRVGLGAGLLLVFLAPTALLFESGPMALKSASLAGALLVLAASGPGRYALRSQPRGSRSTSSAEPPPPQA